MNTPTVPATEPERRLWLRSQLTLRGITLGRLAREAGGSRNLVQKCLWSPYPRAEAVLAKALGLTAQEVWPERYDAGGEPLRVRKPRKGSMTGGRA